MAGAFAPTGFAQMGGSSQPKAGNMTGRSVASSVVSTNMMGASNTPGAGMSGTNLFGGANWIMPGMGGAWWTNVLQMMTNLPRRGAWTNQGQIFSPNPAASRMGMVPSMGGPMALPADLQQMMKQFQSDRDRFIAKQKALETQLKGATEQQRQALMTQMQDQMMQWQQQHAQIRQMMQDQVEQMKQQLMDHQRLIDRVANPGGAGPQGGAMRGRP